MAKPVRLERIADALPAGLAAMRAEARAEGHTMLDTLAAEWEAGKTRFDRAGEALFALYSDGVLAGIGGLTMEPTAPDALRMRRFYVRASFRRGGVGRTLAAALLQQATRTSRMVTVNAAAGSERFWEALGFAPDQQHGHTHVLRRPPERSATAV